MNVDVDLDTVDSREVLDKMVHKLFELWGVSPVDQKILLGDGADDQEVRERERLLLLIHKSLRILFPHNRDLCYAWINKRSDVFAGLTPLEVMLKEGLVGIAGVARYLEWNTER
jgi:Protein of unknown function (DUF2384)